MEETSCAKAFLEDRLAEKIKVGDGVGRMNFATFGVYSIGFLLVFMLVLSLLEQKIFFQIFSVITQKCKHKASSSSTFVFFSFH